ncbi:hypothetical protein GOODEAATRI_027726, partial [Goodea atripinnis]
VETDFVPETKLELDPEAKDDFQQVENKVEEEAEPKPKSNVLTSESTVEAKAEAKIAPVSKPMAESESGISHGIVEDSETVSQAETTGEPRISSAAGDKPEAAHRHQAEGKLEESDKPKSSRAVKSSGSKSKSSKSCSRSRPGTATGMRPGALSPRQSNRLGDLESTGPPEGIESTWPRRIMVRKRTVRQGGALHNLPILPPLPSVLSALEKRHPHLRHGSENPLSNMMNPIVGRCSLREPAHPEPGQGSSLVGRSSLREQNLEHWRVCREQEVPRRSRSREKRGEQSMDKAEKEGKKGKVEKREETLKNEKEQDMELETKPHLEESEVDVREVIPVGEEESVEGWDAVLDMVNTLWDDSWEKREAGGEDPNSPSGSLQRWPLLRPPIGFGGSHPPSSAASELSLTELERRARELDSDLEHLDLSQPHRDVYQTLLEPAKERADMYQTHPGPQRDKAHLHTGIPDVTYLWLCLVF